MGQFALFLISGGIAAFLNWASRFLFSAWMPFELAVVAAFFVGLISGFILMRLYVFDAGKQPIIPQAFKYVLVNILALPQTFVVSVVLLRWVLPEFGVNEHAEAFAHLAGILVPVVSSFAGHKLVTFR